MNIQTKTTGGLTLTPAISEYVEKRAATLKKFFINDPTAICTIDLGKTTAHHKHGDIFRAQIHIVAKDRDIFTSSEKEDLYAAIDDVREQAIIELSTANKKRISLVRRSGRRVKNIIKGLWGKGGDDTINPN